MPPLVQPDSPKQSDEATVVSLSWQDLMGRAGSPQRVHSHGAGHAEVMPAPSR